MCGFIGGTESEWRYAAALETIAHRGPDASKLVLERPVSVGFRRSVDHRPFRRREPTDVRGGFVHVARVQRRDLRLSGAAPELEKLGRRFRTELRHGSRPQRAISSGAIASSRRSTECLRSSSGTRGSKTLKLYRDRAGIKPLYYLHKGRRFAFASELKAIEIACASGEARARTARRSTTSWATATCPHRKRSTGAASNCRRRTGSSSIRRPARCEDRNASGRFRCRNRRGVRRSRRLRRACAR